MKHFFLLTAFLFFTCLSFAQTRNFRVVKAPTDNPVANQTRKAVVIGMSAYGGDGMDLSNTINDATDMANVLTQLGFEVTVLKDNDLQNLENNLNKWYNSLAGSKMAVFYYAGHGVQVKGQNYLLPIDFPHDACEPDVKYKALNANEVVDKLDAEQIDLKLLILDACRTNPFKGSCGRGIETKGLTQMEVPVGTYYVYATAPGTEAQDGGTYNLPNGVFTYYLKQEILKKGASIDDIVNATTFDVSKLTNRQQVPYKGGTLTGNYYFTPTKSGDNPAPNNLPPAPAPVIPKENPNKPANETLTSQANNAQMPANSKIETPSQRMDAQLISTELISNGKEFLLEFLLTNRGEDINGYSFWCSLDNCPQEAYDNLGNKATVRVSLSNLPLAQNFNLPGNTPVKIRVIISGFSSQATSFSRIRLLGQCWQNCEGIGGYYNFLNIPIGSLKVDLNKNDNIQSNGASNMINYSTPSQRMDVQNLSKGLISNGKEFLMEFLLTNRGEDINGYSFWCSLDNCPQEAYDNLGNKATVRVSLSNSPLAQNFNLPGNTPVKIRVIISGFSSQATSFSRIRLLGQCWQNCEGIGGYYDFLNVSIR